MIKNIIIVTLLLMSFTGAVQAEETISSTIEIEFDGSIDVHTYRDGSIDVRDCVINILE